MACDPDPKLDELTSASTGQLLLRAARLLDERALADLAAVPGAPPIRPAHTRLFPHLDARGVRVGELAARLGVSKQAVSPLVADLVGWGVLEQVPDPDDGRARRVRFSAGGLDGIRTGLSALATIEAEVEAEVGVHRMEAFRQVLAAWVRVLG